MTAFTLFDLTYRVARELSVTFEGTATGGGAGTLDDSVWLAGFEDGEFTRGAIWLLRDAGGAGAAPEGQFARVVSSLKAGGVVTHVAFVGANAAAGDRYAVCGKKWPLDIIIQHINAALATLPVKTEDITTITTADAQTEYNLPANMLDQAIETWLQTNTTDADDNAWIQVYDWHIAEMPTGTQKKLIFNFQPPSPFVLKVGYWTPHPPLYVYSDKLREGIDINRVVYDAAYRLLVWRSEQPGEGRNLQPRIAEMYARLQPYKRSNRNRVKLATLGTIDIIISS